MMYSDKLQRSFVRRALHSVHWQHWYCGASILVNVFTQVCFISTEVVQRNCFACSLKPTFDDQYAAKNKSDTKPSFEIQILYYLFETLPMTCTYIYNILQP